MDILSDSIVMFRAKKVLTKHIVGRRLCQNPLAGLSFLGLGRRKASARKGSSVKHDRWKADRRFSALGEGSFNWEFLD